MYFDNTLPLPQVLPDPLFFPNHPTLSSFSKNKQKPHTSRPREKKQYHKIKAKQNIKLQPNKSTYKKPVESTPEYEACPEVLDMPWVTALEKTDFPLTRGINLVVKTYCLVIN